MISARIASYSESADELADDLRAWLAGEDTIGATAAGIMVADTLRRHREVLRALSED